METLQIVENTALWFGAAAGGIALIGTGYYMVRELLAHSEDIEDITSRISSVETRIATQECRLDYPTAPTPEPSRPWYDANTYAATLVIPGRGEVVLTKKEGQIMKVISENPGVGLISASAIGKALGMRRDAVNYHLNRMHNRGMVDRIMRGRTYFYGLAMFDIKDIKDKDAA